MQQEENATDLIDKGPCFLYWQLSYRRRLIRDFWLIGIGIFCIVGLKFFNQNLNFIIYIFPLFGIPQVLYNLYKWRKYEKTAFFTGTEITSQIQNQIDKNKRDFKIEMKFYLSIFVLAFLMAAPLVLFHSWFVKYLLTSQIKNPSMLIIEKVEWLKWFFSFALMGLPALYICLKIWKKKDIKQMFVASSRMYGFSPRFALVSVYISMGFFSIVGLLYQINIFKNYSIFNQEEAIVSSVLPWMKKKYHYSQLKEIHKVKFFIAPSGKRIMRPHFVLVFDDGYKWFSREHFNERNETSEASLLSFMQVVTDIDVKESRYFSQ